MQKKIKVLVFGVILSAGGILFGGHPEFSHDVKGEVKPWTNGKFPDLSVNEGDFSFAVIPDRTGSHREGVFREAMKKINMLRPSFVVSVGDLVEGSPVAEKTSGPIDAQWKELREMTETLDMPFFYCTGNHDISRNTNKSPRRYYISKNAWERNFGKQAYYSFVYRNVLFIVLDCLDGNKEEKRLPFYPEQLQWFLKTLKKHPDVRWTFVFLHMPIFNNETFQAMEQGLQDRNYTVFAGHEHRYVRYNRYGRNYYVLATCGGVVPYEGKKYIEKSRGPEYGEMDHVAWVTMTKKGPVVANIMLDGVIADDIVTQDKNKVPTLEKLDKK